MVVTYFKRNIRLIPMPIEGNNPGNLRGYNYPVEEFCYSFMQRNKERLFKRKCRKVDPDYIPSYFRNLDESVRDVPPAKIVDCDETNLL